MRLLPGVEPTAHPQPDGPSLRIVDNIGRDDRGGGRTLAAQKRTQAVPSPAQSSHVGLVEFTERGDDTLTWPAHALSQGYSSV